MDYDTMTDNELIALSQRLDTEAEVIQGERVKIAKVLTDRYAPAQVLTGAGGIASKGKMGKL